MSTIWDSTERCSAMGGQDIVPTNTTPKHIYDNWIHQNVAESVPEGLQPSHRRSPSQYKATSTNNSIQHDLICYLLPWFYPMKVPMQS